MRSGAVPFVLSAALLAATPSTGQGWKTAPEAGGEWVEAPDRGGMESFERLLEDAVGQVSMPHAGILLGRASASRGYRLPGYGIVYVLTPRALPGERSVFVVRRRGHRLAGDVRVEHHVAVSGDGPGWEPEHVEELERQVLVLQHAAEARRRAAEEDMDRIVEDVRVRLEVADEAGPGEGPDVTVPEGTHAPPPDGALLHEMGEPPWKYWFEAETTEEERSPDRVVEAVRSVLIDTLDSRAGAVVGLAADEYVTVAVDFVSGDVFASRRQPTRTLIVRARQGDLAARAAGTLGPKELRARVEVIQY